MEILNAYSPMVRRQAIARGHQLPDRSHGPALFVDVSDSTALTEALISEIHAYQGSFIGFGGDASTCWFDVQPVIS